MPFIRVRSGKEENIYELKSECLPHNILSKLFQKEMINGILFESKTGSVLIGEDVAKNSIIEFIK